ncbi:MAG TPA: DNA primase [Gammaproteobacteria bacterium]|nr:DNA primase [Gammaproteobacteria bacterium]
MPTISKSYIRRLVDNVRIEDVIGRRLRLIRKGREYSSVCPFHSEKTPSFTVSPHKQFYYCFGCHASGNSIDFLCNFEKIEFPQSIEILAEISGLPIEYEEGEAETKTIDKNNYSKMYNAVVNIYQKHVNLNASAKTYLENRKISEEIIGHFRIGFAPQSKSSQYNFLKKSFTQQQIDESGLVVERSGSLCDRFQNRLIFPIRNRRGNVIALGGRTLTDNVPKYLNSPETAWFHKSKVLYGLYESMSANSQPDKILVVEGYTDVVKLFQHEFCYSVAALGTAFSQSHYIELCRVTSQIVFCFDGDNAGVRAALKACKVCLSSYQDGVDVAFLLLPDKHDPDSYIDKFGKQSFQELIDSSINTEEFLFTFLKSTYPVDKTSGLANYMNDVRALIDSMPNNASKHIFMRRLKNDELMVPSSNTVNSIPLQPAPATNEDDCQIINLIIHEPKNFQPVLDLANIYPSLQTTRIHSLSQAISREKLNTTADVYEWNRSSQLINPNEWSKPTLDQVENTVHNNQLKYLITCYLLDFITNKISTLVNNTTTVGEKENNITKLLKEKSCLKMEQESLEYRLINSEGKA